MKILTYLMLATSTVWLILFYTNLPTEFYVSVIVSTLSLLITLIYWKNEKIKTLSLLLAIAVLTFFLGTWEMNRSIFEQYDSLWNHSEEIEDFNAFLVNENDSLRNVITTLSESGKAEQ